jgi:hypothetical protein
VEGVLCENHEAGVTLAKQPDLPAGAMPPKAGTYVLYLDVFERLVTALDDPLIREKALGGPDTACRAKTAWQIKAWPVAANATCATAGAPYRRDFSQAGKITAQTGALNVDPVPCILPPASGYRSLENQLYRVEIHHAGGFGNATFKWSRENGSVVAAVIAPPNSNATTAAGPTFNVASLGRDAELGFTGPLDWIEALDDRDELGTGSGTLLQVDHVDPGPVTITTKTTPATPLDLARHPKLRRWEQKGNGLGNGILIADGNPIALEQGVEVVFSNGDFRVGDYWLIPARTATDQEFGTIEWPVDAARNPLALPPRGVIHRYAPLAVVTYDGNKFTKVEDCRPPFDDLVELTKRKFSGCCTVSIAPADLNNATLQSIADRFRNRAGVAICLTPGEYQLTQPLNLDKEHSNFIIESCPAGASLHVKPGSEAAFTQGLITIAQATNVTLRGLTIQLPPPPANARADQTYQSIGVRPAGCIDLMIEDCTFNYPKASPNVIATGVFATGNSQGLRLVKNRFQGTQAPGATPVFQTGLAVFPSTLATTAGTAQFVSAELNNGLVRDNTFNLLTFPVLVYAACGLIEIASNVVRNCVNGIWLVSFPLFAVLNDLRRVTVDTAHADTGVAIHNALFFGLANPQVQIANASLRAVAPPPKFDTANALTVRPTAETSRDISTSQNLFDRMLTTSTAKGAATAAPPAAERAAGAAAAERVVLANRPDTLKEHPLTAVMPVPRTVSAANTRFDAFEKVAFGQLAKQVIPFAAHLRDNDVTRPEVGDVPGYELLLISLGNEDRDAATLAGNTFIGSISDFPIAVVFAPAHCTITGNIVLNERTPFRPIKSLTLFPRPIPNSSATAVVLATAVTGNVFRGAPSLPRDIATPPTTWDSYNSIS